MSDEDLLKITSAMEESLGAENFAKISDSVGLLMTENTKTQNSLRESSKRISQLEADKEKLILANGNLLQQIPMGKDPVHEEKAESKNDDFRFEDMFDEFGRFRR